MLWGFSGCGSGMVEGGRTGERRGRGGQSSLHPVPPPLPTLTPVVGFGNRAGSEPGTNPEPAGGNLARGRACLAARGRVGAWACEPEPEPGGGGGVPGGGAGGVGRSGPCVGGGAQRWRAEGAGRGGGPQTTEVSFPVLYYCPPPTTKGSCSLQRALPKNTNSPRPKTAFRCVWFLLDALIVLT